MKCVRCGKKSRFKHMLHIPKDRYEIRNGELEVCFCDGCFHKFDWNKLWLFNKVRKIIRRVLNAKM